MDVGIDTEKCMLEVQDSITQAEGMLADLEKQGMDNTPTATKIKDLLNQLRTQRKTLVAKLPKHVKFTRKLAKNHSTWNFK